MEEGCCCSRGDVLAEGVQQRGAVVGVDGEGGHQLCRVFADLCKWINAWLLLFCRGLTLCALLASMGAPQRASTAAAEMLEQ